MMKYALEKWDKNKGKLEWAIRNDENLQECKPEYLLKLVITHILNDGDTSKTKTSYERWDENAITVANGKFYFGDDVFLFPKNDPERPPEDYLMTHLAYGSCVVCDALLAIQCGYADNQKTPSEKQVKDFMGLCKDLITNMIKPYNHGWRYDPEFDHIEIEG